MDDELDCSHHGFIPKRSHQPGGHAPSYSGGGFTGKSRAPVDALHHAHVVCAFSIVALPPADRGIA
jgi:hypothetical protein